MFMLRQTSVKMAVLLHKQASDRFHPLLTVCIGTWLKIKSNLAIVYGLNQWSESKDLLSNYG